MRCKGGDVSTGARFEIVCSLYSDLDSLFSSADFR